jgi:hypothetical protein
MIPSIGISDFHRSFSRKECGNSYTTLTDEELISLVKNNWNERIPGVGESTTDRKVLVNVCTMELSPSVFFCPPRVPLKVGMPVKTEIVARQAGEDPYLQSHITFEDAKNWGFEEIPAKRVDVVCYSADALQENAGERSTNCDWEIVTILCTSGLVEPMEPLTMARNMLEMPGGTSGTYTAMEFASAIYFHRGRGIRVKGQ